MFLPNCTGAVYLPPGGLADISFHDPEGYWSAGDIVYFNKCGTDDQSMTVFVSSVEATVIELVEFGPGEYIIQEGDY